MARPQVHGRSRTQESGQVGDSRAAESGGPPANSASSSNAAAAGLGDRIASRVATRRSQLVLGLDPDPARLWPRALDAGEVGAPPASRAARAVAAHCELVLEAAGEQCVAVKLQLACFERLGAPGWAALGVVAEAARDRGLLVIADGKRGDIGLTASAYGQALVADTPTPFGTVAGLGADAVTANPLLGEDSLRPLVSAARARGRGVFVLVRTSNPGARDVQEQPLERGGVVSDLLAEIVTRLGADGVGRTGLADVGAVVGATAPERLEALREAMPQAVFLLPGVGPQGGRVEELAPAFAPGPAGGLIAASRAIVDAHEGGRGDPADAARREAVRLRELAWTG
ncbi:MAG: orotidine-5'-phosphate decarboxylase [Solirubrobacterales bacterium]|nr:orotidine-5'-phosphate decarboxylase [Solirubrobacterales bacterium]